MNFNCDPYKGMAELILIIDSDDYLSAFFLQVENIFWNGIMIQTCGFILHPIAYIKTLHES